MVDLRKVLIVGGGISGLAAAILLRKTGIEVDVVEVKKDWKVHHVGIIAQSNFVRAMVTLGVADRCVAAGFPYQTMLYGDVSGNGAHGLPGPQLAGPDYPSNLGLSRPALHTVLSETARESGALIRLGLTITTIAQSPSSVSVTYSDETEATYDVLIGADGVHSKVRTMTLGQHLTPRFTGEGVWRYNVSRPPDASNGIILASPEGPKAGFVPLTQNSAYLFRIGPEPGNPRFDEGRLAQMMRQRLEPFGGLIGRLAPEITDSSLVVYRPLETLLVPPPWYRGRVVLIGDAAHAITPHLGQGAAQAVEDAVVLAEVLAREGSLSQLLDEYMHRRYERCKLVLEASLKIGELEECPDPTFDYRGLVGRVMQTVAQPI